MQRIKINYHYKLQVHTRPSWLAIYFKLFSYLCTIAKLQELLHIRATLMQKISARMNIGTIHDQFSQEVYISFGHSLRVGEYLSNMDWYRHLIDP